MSLDLSFVNETSPRLGPSDNPGNQIFDQTYTKFQNNWKIIYRSDMTEQT